MKHYNNHYSSSRTYYKSLQGKNTKNLNSSKIEVDTLEFYLEKFLSITYKHLSPLFEGDETLTSYKNEAINNFIDKETDEQISKHTPSWIQSIITFFINFFRNYSPTPSKVNAFKPINSTTKSTNRNNVTKHRLTNNFIQNKSSP